MKWYWPKLTGLKEAEQAAHQGAGVCFVITVFTAIVAGMSLWFDRPVLGMDAWAFADAIIFAIAGWRVWRLSRIWAVLALVIYVIEKVLRSRSHFRSSTSCRGIHKCGFHFSTHQWRERDIRLLRV